jgi:hypothetical protein
VRAPVPRIAPSGQQCLGIIRVWAFLSLESLLRASSASTLFDCGLRSLELFSSSVGFNSSNRIFRPSVLSFYSDTDRCPSNLCFVLSMLLNCPKYGGNIPIRMSYVKYEGKSTIGNTRWPGIRIKRALPRNFLYLRYEFLHRWTHRVPHTELGFDLISPYAARVKVAPAHMGSSRGTRI